MAAPGPPARSPGWPLWLAGAGVGGGLVALAVALLHFEDATDVGTGLGVGAVVVALAGIAALVALGGTVREPGLGLVALGVVAVLAGSGVLRWSDDQRGVPTSASGGDIVAVADVVWPLIVVGALLHLAGTTLMRRRRQGIRPLAALAGLTTEVLGLVVIAATMGEVVVGQWIEGRPRRHRGRLVRTAPAPCRSAAEVWAAAAEDEAAAVAAFTALAHRLERVGAPSDLVARSRVAAADEVRHARRCRRLAGLDPVLATRSDGNPSGPIARTEGRGPGRTVEIVRLAVESAVDGVVGEGAAAGRLERGAATAPDLAPRLRAIARDERAHAALGADVVRWCTTQRPRLVTAAVRAAARRVPARTALPATHAGLADADLRAAGLVDRPGAAAVWAAERRVARATLQGRGPAQ